MALQGYMLESAANDILDSMDSLEHYGTKRHSGRYKWGSGERPYQSLEGTGASKKAQKAYDKAAAKDKKRREKEKAQKQAEAKKKAAAQAKADAEAKKKEEAAKAKREAILRDPSRLRENQYSYTPEEVQMALQRFDWDQRMSKFSREKFTRGADYINGATKWLNSGIGLYNTLGKIVSNLDPDATPWPQINADYDKNRTSKVGDKKKPKSKQKAS